MKEKKCIGQSENETFLNLELGDDKGGEAETAGTKLDSEAAPASSRERPPLQRVPFI